MTILCQRSRPQAGLSLAGFSLPVASECLYAWIVCSIVSTPRAVKAMRPASPNRMLCALGLYSVLLHEHRKRQTLLKLDAVDYDATPDLLSPFQFRPP